MKGIIGTCIAALVLLAPVNVAGGQTATPQGGRGAAAPAPKPTPAPAPAPAAQGSAGAGSIIVIETATKGSFEIETYPNEAPRTVAHILGLVKRNFFNGQRVHRVVPGFVIQFGDPNSRDMTKKDRWGTGGSGKPIGVAEMNPKRTHRLGAVAMAHAGDPKNADSQMYVTLAPTPRLDGDYTVFGQVIAGMDVVQKIQVGDVIRRATVKGAAPATKE
jgi:cyclophilin family peptidyl-prolyl cis-trans isomerase